MTGWGVQLPRHLCLNKLMARITVYTQSMADEICRRVAGGERLRAICEEEGMPTFGTVMTWRHSRRDFASMYDVARASQAETLFEEIIDISDDGLNDWMDWREADKCRASLFQ